MKRILTDRPVKLDLAGAIANVRRQGTPSRVFQYEHGIEPPVKQALCERFDLLRGLDRNDPHFELHRDIPVCQFVGLEFLRVMQWPGGLNWQGNLPGKVPPSIGPIQTWRDFEAYSWPSVGDIEFEPVEYLERTLPDNMGLFVVLHFFQRVSDLIGFEPMCMMVYEQPELLEAVTRKVGEFNVEYARRLCAYSRVAMVCLGDDMGHRTGTFISPAQIRDIFIPWHQRISDAAHSAGKLCFMHCCGCIDDIMPDLIDTVGCEAHHSTQDAIVTISDFKKRWGSRIAVLGGIDVDFLTRSPVELVRPYVRDILEQCAPGGGFAIGVSN